MPIKDVKMMIGKKYKAIRGMSADTVFSIANWFLVAALVVGVLATYAIIVSGNIKEAALKREIADTNERAAKLEKEAADAKLETERIKERLAPRTIRDDLFLKELENQPKAQVEILYSRDDPECWFLAMSIYGLLAKAEWPELFPEEIVRLAT